MQAAIKVVWLEAGGNCWVKCLLKNTDGKRAASLGTGHALEKGSWPLWSDNGVPRNWRPPEIPLISTINGIVKAVCRLIKVANDLENKNCPERTENTIIYWPSQVKNRNQTHLLAVQSGIVLHPFTSLWYKEDVIFIRKEASHDAHPFPFLNRLNSPHELSTSSWTLSGDTRLTPDSATPSISEVRLRLWSHRSPSGPTSGVASPDLVHLMIVSLDTGMTRPYKRSTTSIPAVTLLMSCSANDKFVVTSNSIYLVSYCYY